jgi:RNA ligase
MFKTINTIQDIQAAVEGIKEIRFHKQPNGITIGCYMFMDSKTFNTPEALECRGIAFDEAGQVVSRPLHKFFNLGEKEWLSPEKLWEQEAAGDIAAIFEKIDGSMIASCWSDGQLHWRSKKAFNSDVVRLAKDYLAQPENAHITAFTEKLASSGYTVIYELTHPLARIVVAQEKPLLQILHIRHNQTGEYVLLDPTHRAHTLIREYGVPVVRRFESMNLAQLLATLETMQQQEGYVIQFKSGDMVKLKCPWYVRLHRSITFLRERDIALLALNEELDDVKGALKEAGIDLTAVNEVESRLKTKLLSYEAEIEQIYEQDKSLERKDFAIKHKSHPLFGMFMARYLGKEVPLFEWYGRNQLKDDFSLRVLADGALAEAMEG